MDRVTVDFLIQPNNQQQTPGKVTNIEHDLAAVTVTGLDLAFLAKREVSITDRMPNESNLTRLVNVAGPGAFIVLKALAFHLRGENKDAYDLFYVLREVDALEFEADFRRFPDDHPAIAHALQILREDFILSDAGRAQAAEFIEGRRDADIEADVLAAVDRFLRGIE